DPETVTMVVEPRGGGGDAVASDGRRRSVMQFKARGDHRTWSVNEIIDDALVDLYRAVPLEPASRSEYLLVTDGLEGSTALVRTSLRELHRDIVLDAPLSFLDVPERHPFLPADPPITRRELFRSITRRLCRPAEGVEPTARDYRRAWSLLSRFDIR